MREQLNKYGNYDEVEKQIRHKINAIKSDIIIFSVIGIWIVAMCRIFSVILPLDGLIFWKYLLFFLSVLCFFPFLFLLIKNIIILKCLKRKQNLNKD